MKGGIVNALLEALSALGYALDTPGALTRGLLSGKPGERKSGREMLEAWGILGENTEGLDVGDVAGFGADLVVDPLNLIGAGWLGKSAKAAKSAKASNALSDSLRAAGAMPEELAMLTKAADAPGVPKRLYHGTQSAFDKVDMGVHAAPEFGRGHHLTESPEFANSFATVGGFSANPVAWKRAPLEDALRTVTENLQSEIQMGRPKWKTPAAYEQDLAMMRSKVAEVQAELGALPELNPNVRMNYLHTENPLNLREGFDSDRASSLFRELTGKDAPAFKASELENPRRFFEKHVTPAVGRDEMPPRLKELGYDSIAYPDEGGGWVALSPDQLFNPYVAPAHQSTNGPQKALAAMLGYNATRMSPLEEALFPQ